MTLKDSLTIYTTKFCSDCTTIKEFLDEKKVPYEEVLVTRNTEEGREAIKIIENKSGGKVPVLVFSDESFMVEPSNGDVLKKLKELGQVD